MNSLIRLAIGLAALAPAVSAFADDLQVDMVVNLTEAGRNVARPDTTHPVYYYPVSKGYTERGQVLPNLSQPPAEWDVLHTMAKALYDQGYRTAPVGRRPELVLVFWWGYMAPVIIDNSGEATQANGGFFTFGPNTPGAVHPTGLGGGGFDNLTMSGGLMTDTIVNGNEMQALVMGSDYDADNTFQNHPNILLERLIDAARGPRYYVMVSALDFNQALNGKFVVYWTARASTPVYDHTLGEVIPSLVADIAPGFGRDSGGPHITDRPLAPDGQVVPGTPILVTQPASASHPQPPP